MLTNIKDEDDKGAGLIKVRIEDGNMESKIILHDKTPLYLVDGAQTRLFYLRDKKTLQCYEF